MKTRFNETFSTRDGSSRFIINGGTSVNAHKQNQQQQQEKHNNVRIITSNQASGNNPIQWRFPHGSSSGNHEELRKDIFEQVLLNYDADIICLQETLPNFLKMFLPSHVSSSSSSSKMKENSAATSSSNEAFLGFSDDEDDEREAEHQQERLEFEIQQEKQQNQNQQRKEEKITSFPSNCQYVRSKYSARSHCGLSVIFVNTQRCRILFEGFIGGEINHNSGDCPPFPIVAFEKIETKNTNNNNQNNQNEKSSQEDSSASVSSSSCSGETQQQQQQQKVIFVVTSVHLAPFNESKRARAKQLTKIHSSMNKYIDSIWKLKEIYSSYSSSSSSSEFRPCKIVKIVAGDFNMPSDEMCPEICRATDCWTQIHKIPVLQENSSSSSNSLQQFQQQIKQYQEDSYTFGGDNDFNSAGLREIRKKFPTRKVPRYDRVVLVDDYDNNNDDNLLQQKEIMKQVFADDKNNSLSNEQQPPTFQRDATLEKLFANENNKNEKSLLPVFNLDGGGENQNDAAASATSKNTRNNRSSQVHFTEQKNEENVCYIDCDADSSSDDEEKEQQNLKTREDSSSSSTTRKETTTTKSCSIRNVTTTHAQRILDGRVSVISGPGQVVFTSEQDLKEEIIRGAVVKNSPDRFLSDHFGLLFDLAY